MGLINPGAGNIFSSSTGLLTSIAILITNEYISILKKTHIKLRDWIIVITLFYEKTLEQMMMDEKVDQKEAEAWKKIIIITLIKEKR